jgi:hypothetical protein
VTVQLAGIEDEEKNQKRPETKVPSAVNDYHCKQREKYNQQKNKIMLG